jgi:spermidine/putrescine-binding protein
MIKHGSPPLINALSTILLAGDVSCVSAASTWNKSTPEMETKRRTRHEEEHLGSAGGGAAGRLAAAGCGGQEAGAARLHLVGLHQARAGERFEQENGCRVVIDTYDSNEAMYAKLKAGATGYDLLFPSSYMVKIMHEQGMLQKLDLDLIPNLAHIDPDYLKLRSTRDGPQRALHGHHHRHRLSRQQGGGTSSPPGRMLDRADSRGRMTMLNDMRETIGAALKFLGYSLNTTDDAGTRRSRTS